MLGVMEVSKVGSATPRLFRQRDTRAISSDKTRGGINVPNTRQNTAWSGMAFNVSEEQMSWLKGCYVGQTINPEGIPNIQEELLNEGLFTIKAAPMGGNLVLLSPLEAEDLSVIINDRGSNFAKWYSGRDR